MTSAITKAQRLYGLSFCLLLAIIPVTAVSMPRGVAFIPGFIGLLFFVLYHKTYDSKPKLCRAAFVTVFIIGALSLLSAAWSINPSQSLHSAASAILVMLSCCFLVSLSLTLRPNAIRPYLWLIPFSLTTTALLILIEIKCGMPFYRLVRHLPASHAVKLAEFNRATVIIMMLFFPALAILRLYLSRTITAALIFSTMSYLLIIADSQSAQMALILGSLTWLLFPYRYKAAWIGLAVLFFILMLAAPFIFIWTFDHFARSIDDLPMMGTGGGYSGARLELWDYVSRYMLQNPLYGFGFEATRMVKHFDSHEIFQAGTTILHPHNFVLQIWMEFGLVGIVIAGGLMTILLMTMQRQLTIAQARIALPTLIALMSVGSTGYGLWQGWWLGTIGLTAAITILATRQVPSPQRGEG